MPEPTPARPWWRERCEPRALTALAMAAVSLPALLALDLIDSAQAVHGAVLLAWVAVCLLLLRLPSLLRTEGRRLTLLVAVGAVAFGGVLLARSPQPAAAQGGLSFAGTPRISKATFAGVLSAAGSPAAPHGEELYTIIVGYGLDPAVALAFFQHESQFCTTGACARSGLRNWGMQRKAIKAGRAEPAGGFVRYGSWHDSMRDWCELILGYVGRGLDTVEEAIPVYAPTSDGNVPTAYIGAIRRQVAAWSGGAGSGGSADPTLRAYDGTLDQALVSETFLAADLDYHPEWAFHTFMLNEARLGRPLGAPVGESRIISVGGQRYAVQVFAQDTLYTPVAAREADTSWSDVRRLSGLLRALPAPSAATAAPGSPGR